MVEKDTHNTPTPECGQQRAVANYPPTSNTALSAAPKTTYNQRDGGVGELPTALDSLASVTSENGGKVQHSLVARTHGQWNGYAGKLESTECERKTEKTSTRPSPPL